MVIDITCTLVQLIRKRHQNIEIYKYSNIIIRHWISAQNFVHQFNPLSEVIRQYRDKHCEIARIRYSLGSHKSGCLSAINL